MQCIACIGCYGCTASTAHASYTLRLASSTSYQAERKPRSKLLGIVSVYPMSSFLVICLLVQFAWLLLFPLLLITSNMHPDLPERTCSTICISEHQAQAISGCSWGFPVHMPKAVCFFSFLSFFLPVVNQHGQGYSIWSML